MYNKNESCVNMKLEVLLSVVNLSKEKLDKMKIINDCIVINQCNKIKHEKYKNFNIYSYRELGTSNSRNRAIEKATGDILLFCDDDIIYNDKYEEIIVSTFKKYSEYDVIFFNLYSPNRQLKVNKRNRKVRFYNYFRYGTPMMVIKKESLDKANVRFNNMFGPNAKYNFGEDTLFIHDLKKKGLKLFCVTDYIGTCLNENSFWFNNYDETYFFSKGALFCAISKHFRYLLFFQYLLRYYKHTKNIGIIKAFNCMIMGSKSYLKDVNFKI